MSLTNVPVMTMEARSAPHRVAELLVLERDRFAALGARLRAADPAFAVTVGRGSSDHAGLYARYLLETGPGLVTASAAPSVVTAYAAPLKLSGSVVLALSQSGASPDVVRFVEHARSAGAITVAILNQVDSPLGRAAEMVLPLHAGEEHAVAATKSFICTTAATALLTSEWTLDPDLGAAIDRLPDDLSSALESDWSAAVDALEGTERLLVVARGRALPIASEMALKFKEVAGIQAEAFSAAEVLHGPLAVVDPSRPVVLVATEDETLGSVVSTAERLRSAGAHLLVITASPLTWRLDGALALPRAGHPALDPLLAIQAFYPFVATLALARGLDPDQPPHLTKVTKTL